MVTERTIINGLIIGATCIFAPYMIYSLLQLDFIPLACFVAFIFFITLIFMLKDNLCLFPIICLGAQGSFNFLPLPLKAFHVFCILLIVYYFTGYVVLRQKRINVGKTQLFWPIIIILSIMLYHNHSLNLHVFGSETEGSKPAFMVYLVILAYFCGINVSKPSVSLMKGIPFWFFIATFLSSLPFLLTTFVPSVAPYLYLITDNVNVDAYITANDSSGKFDAGIGRLGALGVCGGALQVYLISRYPLATWLRPERWWVAILSFLCLSFAVLSGYRNVLVSFSMITMIGAWCYYSYRALAIPILFFIVALLFIVASTNGIIPLPENKLPIIAQRTLSFLPGNWNPDAVENAKASNEFRQGIQEVYIKEYMRKSPWIGNGFDINTREFQALNTALLRGDGQGDNNYLQSKSFIEGKLFHTGWISVYDNVGIIGSIAFLVLAYNVILMAIRLVFGPNANRHSSIFPLYVWLLCNCLNMMIAYFLTFGDFAETFVVLCIYSIVLTHLVNINGKSDANSPVSSHQKFST